MAELSDFYGVASDLLSSAHKFSRKQKKVVPPTVHIHHQTKEYDQIVKLVEAKIKSREYANGRGDYDGVPAYFEAEARNFADKNKL